MSDYKAHYSQSDVDFGTERELVLVYKGVAVARRDPFWPAGIPTCPKRRKARLQEVAQEMIEAHKATNPPHPANAPCRAS